MKYEIREEDNSFDKRFPAFDSPVRREFKLEKWAFIKDENSV